MFLVTPQVAKAVWVDDANSTGSSLKAGIEMLKSQYNIEVTHLSTPLRLPKAHISGLVRLLGPRWASLGLCKGAPGGFSGGF